MNQRPQGLKVKKAMAGFLQYKSAKGLAPVTVTGYERDLKLLIEHIRDIDVGKINSQHILSFLNYMRTDYVPRRIAGDNSIKLAPKTVYNIYASLASFLTWAGREFELSNPMKNVPRPRVPEDAPVEPFKKDEIELLIKTCGFCEEAVTDRRHKFIMQRSTGKRDKAILLTLLDTGLRASELCAPRIGDVDMKSGKAIIRSGEAGSAKGGKGRIVYLGKSARRFVWRYLAVRDDADDLDAPLFIGKFNKPFNQDALRQLINSLGAKVGVKKCHPHRFWHTFAITYLRSGGDIFTLKLLLGHGSLDMVEHYARIARRALRIIGDCRISSRTVMWLVVVAGILFLKCRFEFRSLFLPHIRRITNHHIKTAFDSKHPFGVEEISVDVLVVRVSACQLLCAFTSPALSEKKKWVYFTCGARFANSLRSDSMMAALPLSSPCFAI